VTLPTCDVSIMLPRLPDQNVRAGAAVARRLAT
jgi:hypothetical protein